MYWYELGIVQNGDLVIFDRRSRGVLFGIDNLYRIVDNQCVGYIVIPTSSASSIAKV